MTNLPWWAYLIIGVWGVGTIISYAIDAPKRGWWLSLITAPFWWISWIINIDISDVNWGGWD